MDRRALIKLYKKISPETLTLEEAKKEIDIFTETLVEALLINEKIKFQNVGVFEIISRQPKIISNPSTRERMTIYPKKKVRFRGSKSLTK